MKGFCCHVHVLAHASCPAHDCGEYIGALIQLVLSGVLRQSVANLHYPFHDRWSEPPN